MDSALRGTSKRREVEDGLVAGMLEHGPGPSSCLPPGPGHPPVLFYLKFRHLAVVTVRSGIMAMTMVRCHCALVQPSRVCLRVLHLLQLVVALRLGHQDSLPGLEHRTLYIR